MGVDIIDLRRRDPGAPDRGAHAAIGAVAVLGGRRDMMRIARHAVADQLGVNLGAAPSGVLEFLQHDNAGALAHDEAIAIAVIGPRRPRRLVVEGRRQARGRRQTRPCDERSSGDSAPPATITSASPSAISRAGIADRMRAGRTGGDDGMIGAL